jgi:hypothetical protein
MKAVNNKAKDFFKKALAEMFKVVGFAGFDEEFTMQEGWYSKREWTAQQRDEFRKWFVVNAKKDLRWGKNKADMEFSFFDLMWGWRDSGSTSKAKNRQPQSG